MLERFAAQSLVEHEGEMIFSKEKFAELIVRECGVIADANVDGTIYPSALMKKHFGVE
jgi:hypothetical protein